MAIYHEDIVERLRDALPCDGMQANELRFRALKRQLTTVDRDFIRENSDDDLLAYVEREAPFGFCKAHVAAHGRFVKRCAVLKSRHRELYHAECARWEDAHGLSWGDFGYRSDAHTLLK